MQFAPGLTNNRPVFVFSGNHVTNTPVATGERAPGGVIIVGAESVNHFNYATVENNFFDYVGGDTIYGSGAYHVGIAAIDWYRHTMGTIRGNIGTNLGYYFIKAQQSSDILVDGNIGHGTGSGVFIYTPMERSQVTLMKRAIFKNNWAYIGTNDTIGFSFNAGTGGGFYETEIDGFFYPNGTRGMQIEGADDADGSIKGFGPVTLNNIHLMGSTYGLRIHSTAGRIKISNSVLQGTNTASGLFMIQTNTASTLILDNVTARSYGAGWGARLWGIGSIVVKNSRFEALGGGESIEIQDDADGANVGSLYWDRNNSTSGTRDIVTADIDAGYSWDGAVVTHYPSGWTLTIGNGTSAYHEEKRSDGAEQRLGTRWRNMTSGGGMSISIGTESAAGSFNAYDDTFVGSFADMIVLQAESDASALVLRAIAGSQLHYIPSAASYRWFINSIEQFKVDDNATAGNTRFLIYDVDNGTLERVSVGIADSGGAGFKVLRIPN
jgi:hypothetical protein